MATQTQYVLEFWTDGPAAACNAWMNAGFQTEAAAQKLAQRLVEDGMTLCVQVKKVVTGSTQLLGVVHVDRDPYRDKE